MAIIRRPAGINRRHPAGPSPCQHEPSSLHWRTDTVDFRYVSVNVNQRITPCSTD